MAFYDVFEQLCNERGITPTQVARDNGLTQQTVSHWKTRGSTPKAETVQKLADYFGVSVDYLLGAKVPPKQRSPFKAGESYFGGDIRVINVSVDSDGRETITVDMNVGELSAEDIAGYFEMFKKMADLGMSVDVISRLVDAAASVANDISRHKAGEQPETAPESTPVPTEGKDTIPPPDAPETPPEEEWDRYGGDRYGGRRDE